MMGYCILTFPWLVPPDTNHSFIKTSNQLNKNRICQKQTSLKQSVYFVYFYYLKKSKPLRRPGKKAYKP